MIRGLGVDLCRVERIRRTVVRFGKGWPDEVFSEEEQVELGPGDQPPLRAAIGFALKEACAEALGTGFAEGIRRQDVVVSLGSGDCSLRLTSAEVSRLPAQSDREPSSNPSRIQKRWELGKCSRRARDLG